MAGEWGIFGASTTTFGKIAPGASGRASNLLKAVSGQISRQAKGFPIVYWKRRATFKTSD
jgi:hypothetical protein